MNPSSSKHTALRLEKENEKFNTRYEWFINNMPEPFFQEIDQPNLMLIIYHLMEFEAQGYSSIIQLKHSAIVICLDQPNTDLKVLNNFSNYGIQDYETYISREPPSFLNIKEKVRVIIMHFYGEEIREKSYRSVFKIQLRQAIHNYYPSMTDQDFDLAFEGIRTPFLHAISLEKAVLAIAMFYRALTRDKCQYEVSYDNEEEATSMGIVLAWRNTPRHNFLYRLIRIIERHGLTLKKLDASYNDPYRIDSILLVTLELGGADGKPVGEKTDILDFVKELTTVKYFASFDLIDHYLIQPGIISGNMGNFLRAITYWIHQNLVQLDVNLYNFENIEEGLCRHPELTAQICTAFRLKFDPTHVDMEAYSKVKLDLITNIEKLDTGHSENDARRKNILRQAINLVEYTLKTNFYRPNYTALSFRLDPQYLEEIPFDRTKKFPEMPFAIIFIKGMHFFGFHIRFKDLARGGLRTVFPDLQERLILERNSIFNECYNLALTQHMKNKDIPEGGAKGIILLRPYEHLETESAILKHELQNSSHNEEELNIKLAAFEKEQKQEHLYQAQRSFIENLITLVNCDPSGQLRAKDILDYWGKPEYLYLGPDENLHDAMIEWIASYSKKHHYKPGSSFISGKPSVGINHKKYGVTSLGLNVYMDALLRYLKIDPTKEIFTVKLSGGPDGDVAGNEILNLHQYYPNTAKVVALTDVSGTIYDPEGLDLPELVKLVKLGQSIKHYPPEKLHDKAFLIDKATKRSETTLIQQTLCWRKNEGKLIQDWLSGSDMNYLIRHNVHQVFADIFIPAGGRPRTLNEVNYKDFLDSSGKPTARGIVEGANLYLTNGARNHLEDLGVLIIKDSSANKTGVICSSFEVLCGLTLGDDLFLKNKTALIQEILARLNFCAANEANLLLNTHAETGERLTEISDRISKRINLFTDQILAHLESIQLPQNPHDLLIQCFFNYCLPILYHSYQKELILEVPDQHKKAIIACFIAAHIVYKKGLSWFPSIVDILPILLDKEGVLAIDNVEC